MRKYFYIGFLFCVLYSISGCSKPAPEDVLLFYQTRTKEERALLPTQTASALPIIEPTKIPEATTMPFPESVVSEDFFVYSTIKNPPELEYYLFIPELDHKYEILSELIIFSFSLNTKNELAFVTDDEDGHAVYIDTFPFSGNELQKIAGDANTYYDLLSWSHDGKYLALVQLQHQLFQIMIWDGENLFPIYTFQNQVYDAIWSKENRLAFVEHRFDCDNCDHAEVYVWDGDRTLNVSHNPEAEDGFPAWSNDGQLAFLSDTESIYSIHVWDGRSFENDLPSTYQIDFGDAIHLWFYSSPAWTPDNQLLVHAGPLDNQGFDHYMINLFMWENGVTKPITHCTEYHCGGMLHSEIGYWSYITMMSYPSLIFVMDENNQQVAALDSEYMPAWSSKDDLIYCYKDRSGWVLKMWNLDSLINIDTGYEIIGQWNNGNKVFCTSG